MNPCNEQQQVSSWNQRNEWKIAWNGASEAVHKICVCYIIKTINLPVPLENGIIFVNLQGLVGRSNCSELLSGVLFPH